MSNGSWFCLCIVVFINIYICPLLICACCILFIFCNTFPILSKFLSLFLSDVPSSTIRRLALSFQDLRAAFESQELSYPYSAREAVSVVKHLQVCEWVLRTRPCCSLRVSVCWY